MVRVKKLFRYTGDDHSIIALDDFFFYFIQLLEMRRIVEVYKAILGRVLSNRQVISIDYEKDDQLSIK